MSIAELVQGKSFDELSELIAEAAAAQEAAKQRAIEEFESLVVEIKERATQLGLDVKTFFVEKKEKKEFPPKYRNPNNSDETWNGRGPRPAWLKELLAQYPSEDWKEQQKQFLI